MFMACVFVWNPLSSESEQLDITTITLNSVVSQAVSSWLVSFLILASGGPTLRVWRCWASTVPIVVFGAPTGAILLNPKRIKYFYAGETVLESVITMMDVLNKRQIRKGPPLGPGLALERQALVAFRCLLFWVRFSFTQYGCGPRRRLGVCELSLNRLSPPPSCQSCRPC